jgi:hypothetical protein
MAFAGKTGRMTQGHLLSDAANDRMAADAAATGGGCDIETPIVPSPDSV